MAHDQNAYDVKFDGILRAAALTFAEKGYHQASIRDIARAARVSLSGLYYYFQSKEELLFLIQDHAFGSLLDELDRKLAGVTDPRRRLQLLIENHLRFFVDNMAEMKVLSHEADSLNGEFRTQVNAKKRRLTRAAMGILSELRADDTLDLRVSTYALFGMMNWLHNWYDPRLDVPVGRLAENISQLFLHGYLQSEAQRSRSFLNAR